MKTPFALLLLIFLINIQVSAQYYTNQNKIWIFGNKAGVDFTSGTPVSFTSSMNKLEGCASVSDASGNLLFYTDGKTVWNRTGTIMPSGSAVVSFSNASTAQGAVVVQALNNPNQYYLFSLEDIYSSIPTDEMCSLAYSVIDMSLNGGLGDVVTASMGTLIDTALTEKMMAVPGNNCNMWLVVHKRNAAQFRAYEITSAGINLTPVISTSGTYNKYHDAGIMAISPDRRKIAYTTNIYTVGGSAFRTELYDFDPGTGMVSNSIVLNTKSFPYGAEFSPDNTRLYTTAGTATTGAVYQYNISLPSAAAIIASEYTVTSFLGYVGSLKLAPDNKIYFTQTDSTFLHCIAAPNLSGASCDLITNAISIFPNKLRVGFPALFWSAAAALPPAAIICEGLTTTLPPLAFGGTWSSSNTAVATVTGTGVVTGVAQGVAVISYAAPSCTTPPVATVATTTVTVHPIIAPIAGSMNACTNRTTALSTSPAGGIWTTNNTSVANISPVSGIVTGISAGTSVVTYSFGGICLVTATLTVHNTPAPITGAQSVACIGSSFTLSDATSGGIWTSSNTNIVTIMPVGAGNSIATGINVGTADITYTTSGGCFDTASVVIRDLPVITGPSHVCIGTNISLSGAPTGGAWTSTNTIAATVDPSSGISSGLSQGNTVVSYSLGATCIDTQTIIINGHPDSGTITGISALCAGNTTTLSDNIPGGIWSSGSPTIATVSATGIVSGLSAGTVVISYSVTNNCATAAAVKSFTVHPQPAAGSIVGIAQVCPGASYLLSETVAGGTWNSSNTLVATVGSTGDLNASSLGKTVISYTVISGAGCSSIATYTVTVSNNAAFTLNSILAWPPCYADSNSITVNATGGIPPFDYLWSTGDTTAVIKNLASGLYSLQVTERITHCIQTDTLQMVVPDSIIIQVQTITDDKCDMGKGAINVNVNGGTMPYSYLWSNSVTEKDISDLHSGMYTLSVTDSRNCIGYGMARVNDTCSNLVIPDVITPNGDGLNDTWEIQGLDSYPTNTVQVFDKHGYVVFEHTNYQGHWYGQGKNALLPDGTYYYLIKLNAKNTKGGPDVFTGSLLIKR